ncbi:hypothetical protein [Streptomyces sp. AC512_CC834]|uniref:hypothetical protein n=1 Tax=Streptomyces sp. AC512_CC834 TaxID=2823691 RepID=UPI001C27A90D|nr:hypothetical protein [Streptomyces sp. AC512_CC834]
MTDQTSNPRVPDASERVVTFRTEPRPDGSTVLVLRVPGPPYTLIEHRMRLDRYLTRALLHTLTRDLRGIEAPGPSPESAALLRAIGSTDPTALSTALDAYSARILSLWTDGGEAA